MLIWITYSVYAKPHHSCVLYIHPHWLKLVGLGWTKSSNEHQTEGVWQDICQSFFTKDIELTGLWKVSPLGRLGEYQDCFFFFFWHQFWSKLSENVMQYLKCVFIRYFNIFIVNTREGLAILAHLYQPSLYKNVLFSV